MISRSSTAYTGTYSATTNDDLLPDSKVYEEYPRPNLSPLLTQDRLERDWVINGLVPAGASVALVAPAGEPLFLFAAALTIVRTIGRSQACG
jgi:hypothetical protein